MLEDGQFPTFEKYINHDARDNQSSPYQGIDSVDDLFLAVDKQFDKTDSRPKTEELAFLNREFDALVVKSRKWEFVQLKGGPLAFETIVGTFLELIHKKDPRYLASFEFRPGSDLPDITEDTERTDHEFLIKRGRLGMVGDHQVEYIFTKVLSDDGGGNDKATYILYYKKSPVVTRSPGSTEQTQLG